MSDDTPEPGQHARPWRKPARAEDPAPRTVGFVLVPDFPLMAYTAAVEPLRAANTLSGCELYRWWHAAPGGGVVQASNGLGILTDVAVGARARADRVFVCAGGNPAEFDDPSLFAWLRGLARHGATLGGISGGPYLLARAGLLSGRRCTLHWEHVPAFEERYPEIEVVRSLFEIQGDRITCSGGIAALDLMLDLIGRDHGAGLAAGVSDWFLHNQIREGLSPQRMDLRQRFGVRDPRLLRVLAAMEANLEAPVPREALADLAHVSVRQLERLFREGLGRGLHRHYLHLRLDRAHQLGRESALSRAEIAAATGFASADELSRAERRRHRQEAER
ncbi:transcriptional regulator, AraC family [Methylorubrum extorquens]|uniref:Transcriptional regulator, AraC family n=1 Tax=Methylorubrum extorquens TaxID=408 RepID=A0A2N9AUI1_METEX|nr:GlxA family transcriptional regulator [Methylorubrum zatmanii]ARO55461.1 AraC family transcriptional regulator [Methylorubrum zatmanii]KQP97140.1 transcriptional regulator [Methylobacterium sp. Leaf121]SOR30938.1 transcriptional regulator, AraC family [Methylorubrum extorquens]